MATLSSCSGHLLHRFFLRRQSLPLTTHFIPASTTTKPFFIPSRLFTAPLAAISSELTTPLASISPELENGIEILDEEEFQFQPEKKPATVLSNLRRTEAAALPNLSVKEKKELASYANSLGKNLKSQQVGKLGVTDTVIMALGETLERNELMKLKIHGNCPSEMDDAVKRIEEGTGSLAVSRIGRTVILYRPSVTKLQAEEKKKQNQREYLKKKAIFQSRRSSAPVPREDTRQNGRGRRGSSRF